MNTRKERYGEDITRKMLQSLQREKKKDVILEGCQEKELKRTKMECEKGCLDFVDLVFFDNEKGEKGQYNSLNHFQREETHNHCWDKERCLSQKTKNDGLTECGIAYRITSQCEFVHFHQEKKAQSGPLMT